jgi:PDZ domain-containing protein
LSARITPFRVAATLAGALVVTCFILLKINSGDYLLLPDIAHPVAPLVRVEGAKPVKGGGELFFVDVQEQQASEFDILFQSLLHPHSTSVPVKELFPPGFNSRQYQRLGLLEMKFSKQYASIVAERRLGYHVVFKPLTRVDAVDPHSHARGILKPGDTILAVNGIQTPTADRLRAAIGTVKPGATVSLRIRRGSNTETLRVKTSNDNGTPIVGVELATKLVLPVKVTIDSGDIGGPSAGLAFTLEVMRKLGYDVTHGYKVAATGQMQLNGTVTAIGGVEQKTWGVREAGAQIFLVPADGGNAKTAERYAGPNLKIIPVTSIGQALRALAALPKLK